MFEQVGSDLTFYATFVNRNNGNAITDANPAHTFYHISTSGTVTTLTPGTYTSGQLGTSGTYFAVLPLAQVASQGDYVCIFLNQSTTNAFENSIRDVYNVGRAGIDVLAKKILESVIASPPSKEPTLKEAVMLVYMALRNKNTTSLSQLKLYNDVGGVIATAALTDVSMTFTREKLV